MNHVLKTRLHYRVLVTLKSGAAFQGVLWEQDKQALVLRDTEAVLDGGRSSKPVDGELVVLLADVDYLQRP